MFVLNKMLYFITDSHAYRKDAFKDGHVTASRDNWRTVCQNMTLHENKKLNNCFLSLYYIAF
jgi:hypothetical protein